MSVAIFFEGLPASASYTLPKTRDIPSQSWAFFRIEADNLFNWTITYRLDSDVTWFNTRFLPIGNGSQNVPTLESLRDKKLIAYWMVSYCHARSGRDDLTESLMKFVKVDIYGNCGPMSCSHSDNCYEILGKQYKFYLAFENSLCTDVTEKMYFAMKNGMVPVVYADPSFTKIAIPGSYINVYAFAYVRELVDYLKYLDTNPVEYLQYFEWMKKFVMLSDDDGIIGVVFVVNCTQLM